VAGALLGSAVGALFSTLMTDAALHSWGWRLAFILSILVGGAAMYLSKKVPEVSLDEEGKKEFEGTPIWEALRTQKAAMLRVIGIVLAYSVGYYLVFLYITTFLIDIVKIPASEALDINTISMVVLMCLLPVMAKLSDKLGRKPVLIAASLGLIFLSYPLFWMMHHHHAMIILGGQLGFALFIAAFAGTNPVTMVEAFPSHLRCSAMSFAFNVCFALFGGTTPMVAAYLIKHTHDDLSIAFLLMGAGLLSLIALLVHPETARKRLH
jgi:MHS family proline/betaine transporter-like MFS transporter